jgi:hypothetical protein
MFNHARTLSVLLLLSAAGLSAGTLTIALPTVNETSPTVGGIVILPQFNSSLGTLTGVSLDFGPASISADTEISDFEPGGTINITYSLGYQVTFTLPVGGPFVVEDAQDLNCSGFGPEFATCDSSQGISFSPINGSYDLSSDAAAFLSGTVPVSYTPTLIESKVGGSTPTNPSNLSLSVTGESATIPLSITFTYTPTTSVPEPGSLVLAGAGLLGLGWFGRKRKQS